MFENHGRGTGLELAEEIEQTGEPPSHELVREFAEMGYLGINISEELGGLGPSDMVEGLTEWMTIFERCLKCHGCKISCPVCGCKECTASS